MEVQLENQMVLVQTTLPSQVVQALLEDTGRQAVLKGMGSGRWREYTVALALASLGRKWPGCDADLTLGFGGFGLGSVWGPCVS